MGNLNLELLFQLFMSSPVFSKNESQFYGSMPEKVKYLNTNKFIMENQISR
jgi:hypothetical protein